MDEERNQEERTEETDLREAFPKEEAPQKEPEDWGSMTGFWGTYAMTAGIILSVIALYLVFGGNTGNFLALLMVLLVGLAVISAPICWMRNIARRQRVIEEKLDRLLKEREDKPSAPAVEP